MEIRKQVNMQNEINVRQLEGLIVTQDLNYKGVCDFINLNKVNSFNVTPGQIDVYLDSFGDSPFNIQLPSHNMWKQEYTDSLDAVNEVVKTLTDSMIRHRTVELDFVDMEHSFLISLNKRTGLKFQFLRKHTGKKDKPWIDITDTEKLIGDKPLSEMLNLAFNLSDIVMVHKNDEFIYISLASNGHIYVLSGETEKNVDKLFNQIVDKFYKLHTVCYTS